MSTKLVTKSVEATIENVPDEKSGSDTGEFRVVLATPGADREGDDLQGKGWKLPLPDHIVFDTDHSMRVEKTVGSGKPELKPDGTIEVTGPYAPTDHAQLVRSLVPKHIRTVSVTYLERITKGVGGKRTVTRELLAGSFVPVPANPKAVVLSSKAMGEPDTGDAEETAETMLAQSIHDMACQLGADCSPENVEETAEKSLTIVTKGISGSIEDMTQRIRDALRELYSGNQYAWVRATFLDEPGKGTVVYQVDGPTSSTTTLARPFTDDGTEVKLGEPREVSLITSVVDASDVGEDDAATEAKAFDGAQLDMVAARLVIKAADPKKPYGDVPYADPGYQSDGKKRYPIDTADHVRAAWSYINQSDNAGKYSSANLAKIKARIRAAAKRLGVEISSKSVGTTEPAERAIEVLCRTGMTRDAAAELLGVHHKSATLASSEGAPAGTPAAAAAEQAAAAAGETAAAPLDMRARALIMQTEDAAS